MSALRAESRRPVEDRPVTIHDDVEQVLRLAAAERGLPRDVRRTRSSDDALDSVIADLTALKRWLDEGFSGAAPRDPDEISRLVIDSWALHAPLSSSVVQAMNRLRDFTRPRHS